VNAWKKGIDTPREFVIELIKDTEDNPFFSFLPKSVQKFQNAVKKLKNPLRVKNLFLKSNASNESMNLKKIRHLLESKNYDCKSYEILVNDAIKDYIKRELKGNDNEENCSFVCRDLNNKNTQDRFKYAVNAFTIYNQNLEDNIEQWIVALNESSVKGFIICQSQKNK